MKIDIMIVSVTLIFLVVLPFFLLPLIHMRENKKLQNKFLEEALKYNLHIDLKESWNSNVIGIDSAQKKLLLVQQQQDLFFSECIDLSQMQNSRVIITTSQIKRDRKPEEVLQRTDIEFSPLNGDDKKLLNLFDYDSTFVQDLEVKHAEKWNSLIQKHLCIRPFMKRTA